MTEPNDTLFDSREFVPTAEVMDAASVDALPTFEKEKKIQLAMSFDTDEDRQRLIELLGLRPTRKGRQWPCFWPPDEEPDAQEELF